MKVRVSHPYLRELFEQLRFAPVRQKKKQLAAAEHLMMILDKDRDYPFDFIVFRITGYRSQGDTDRPLIPGQSLLRDLRVWIAQLSTELSLNVADMAERIYTVEELAGQFNVSTKTIRRWQKRGLTGKIYVFPEGHKRLGFTESAVDDFKKIHFEMVEKAGHFSVLSETEKNAILELAQSLVSKNNYRTQNELVMEIVVRSGRARQTVRNVLDPCRLQHPVHPTLPGSRGKMAAKDISVLYRQYRQGAPARELVQQYRRSRSSIYRIINQQRAKEILGQKVDYIPSPEFSSVSAEHILSTPLDQLLTGVGSQRTLLSRKSETDLFRRYNFLKYCLSRERAHIQLRQPRASRLDRIESLRQEAEKVKKYIIESNMPLVVSISGKHLGSGIGMNELVSEGSVALMAAVEKFDYTRGYRFSTYASWAIAKDFARMIPSESRRPDRAGGIDFTNLPSDIRMDSLPDVSTVEQAQRDLRSIIENNLDRREQYVILNHFALDPGVIKKKSKTLKQIGVDLNLSKERIRQIELQALQKLRQSLSPEQFDLLTG